MWLGVNYDISSHKLIEKTLNIQIIKICEISKNIKWILIISIVFKIFKHTGNKIWTHIVLLLNYF